MRVRLGLLDSWAKVRSGVAESRSMPILLAVLTRLDLVVELSDVVTGVGCV